MAKSTGGSRKLLWVLVFLVVLSSGGAAAAIYLVLNQDAGPAAEASEVQLPAVRKTPIFVKVDPFTVNLADDDYGSRLLYTGMSLKVGDDQTREILMEHMPQVRSRLLIMFSGQQAKELTQPGGKQALSEQVLAVLQEPLAENQPPLVIEEVLFTEFIVQ